MHVKVLLVYAVSGVTSTELMVGMSAIVIVLVADWTFVVPSVQFTYQSNVPLLNSEDVIVVEVH